MALAIIYQGIPAEHILLSEEKKSAKEALEAIRTMCVADRVKKAKVQTLRAELESLTMKDTEQIDDFCLRLWHCDKHTIFG